jgi:hypothetical protein
MLEGFRILKERFYERAYTKAFRLGQAYNPRN